MRRIILAQSAALAFLAEAPALAIHQAGERMDGFYVGVHAGYAIGNEDWVGPINPLALPAFVVPNPPRHHPGGAMAGAMLGGRLQSGRLLFGVEAEASWADLDDETPSTYLNAFTNRTEIDWTASVTAQLGIRLGNAVPYVEAGIGFVGEKHAIVDGNGAAPDESDRVSATREGFVAGGGVEVLLGGGWSARGEYNYGSFGTRDYVIAGNGWRIDQNMHSFRLGVLYRFGG